MREMLRERAQPAGPRTSCRTLAVATAESSATYSDVAFSNTKAQGDATALSSVLPPATATDAVGSPGPPIENTPAHPASRLESLPYRLPL